MDSDSSESISVLQLRISLRGVSPPVWRRLLIPEQITIAQLHQVMQLAMGWNDEPLHRFVIRGWRYGEHRDGALQFFDGPDTLSLAAFGLHEHERFAYLYDFTSWWLHDVRVERRTCVQRSSPFPVRRRRHRSPRPARLWRLRREGTRLVSRRHAIQNLEQMIKGLRGRDERPCVDTLIDKLRSAKWHLWHGCPHPALQRLESLGWELATDDCPEEARLLARVEEFIGYLENNSALS